MLIRTGVVALVLSVGIGIVSNLAKGPSGFLFVVFWTVICACSMLDERALRRRSEDLSGALGWRWLWVFPSTLILGTAIAWVIGHTSFSVVGSAAGG
ncbi:hypothetical protein [Brevundimonas kwangchunensis]|uniref:hypothetical protein n=1 Tax=Brevundimonas kwangchunensis TaxID=322163 RepID=UPI0031DCAA44